MKKRRTQQWLQEIYKDPKRYEDKVVIILNDSQIVGVAEDFAAAKREREQLAASSPSIYDGKMTLFLVPRQVKQVRIRTLRLRSLREDLWEPVYPVNLQTNHGEIQDCEMLIDSGADISLIPFDTGRLLGLSRSDEEILSFAQGVGGEVSYLLRRICLTIDGHSVSTMVAWCQDEEIEDMIVGRQNVFDAFHIEFRQSERRIIFKPVEDKDG
jgi:hypothetical protein